MREFTEKILKETPEKYLNVKKLMLMYSFKIEGGLLNWCYCGFENFFEENNIHIDLFYNSILKSWCFQLFKFEEMYKKELDFGYGKIKSVAKRNAILKACEILELTLISRVNK